MILLDKKEFFSFYLNCRRGMLELDILLLNFLDTRFYDLDLQFKKDFYQMLLESDNNLYSWLVKKVVSKNLSFNYIIFEINRTNDMFEFY